MLLSNLAAKLRKHGLTVVEHPGWASRGFLGRDLLEVRGVLWHHTATNRARFTDNPAPTVRMCIEGRPDVAGPLCNIVFGRDGTVHLVAAGLANHAGAGAAPNIPRDLGNYYLIGIEMESSGVAPWDWTADQLRVAPYLGAALELEYLGHLPPDMRLQIAHKEYSSTGKIDPAGWPGDMDGLRSAINKVLAGGGEVKPAGTITQPTKEAVVAVSDKDARELASVFWNTNVQEFQADGKTKGGVKKAAFILGNLNQWVGRILEGQLRTDAKVAALAEIVRQQGAGEPVDYDKVDAIVQAALASAVVDVNVNVNKGVDDGAA